MIQDSLEIKISQPDDSVARIDTARYPCGQQVERNNDIRLEGAGGCLNFIDCSLNQAVRCPTLGVEAVGTDRRYLELGGIVGVGHFFGILLNGALRPIIAREQKDMMDAIAILLEPIDIVIKQHNTCPISLMRDPA